jgi:hypothetical protein
MRVCWGVVVALGGGIKWSLSGGLINRVLFAPGLAQNVADNGRTGGGGRERRSFGTCTWEDF